MNAIELLIADHEAVEELFQQVEGSDATEHPELFRQIKPYLKTWYWPMPIL